MTHLLTSKNRPPAPNTSEPDLPMVVTKIEVIVTQPDYYRVTFNLIWRLINDFNQIKESANNWDEIKNTIIPIERRKKINRIMNIENKIYRDKILFEKNNY